MEDRLICRGSEVKALGAGRVGGYLVLFGDAETPDASSFADYFTPETEFDIQDGAKSAVYYRHALDASLDRKLTDASMKVDDVGVWVEGQLNLRDRYEKAVYGMAEAKKLGWSSGTASHLVKREKQDNGAHKIIRWPLGLDASLTPDPAEPRTQAIALKSLGDSPALTELVPALKSEFLGECVEREMTMASLRALNEALMYSVVWKVLYDEALTTEQKQTQIAGALAEFAQLATETLSFYLSQDAADEAMKALRTLWGPDRPESLADHSVKVVSAVADLADRLESRLEARKTDGRSLSAGNREALKSALDSLGEVEAVKARLARVLTAAAPLNSETSRQETERLRTQFLRLTSPLGAN